MCRSDQAAQSLPSRRLRSNRKIRRSFRRRLAGQPLKPGPHKIQGTGAGFVPKNLASERQQGQSADHRMRAGDAMTTAFAMARRLAKEEGILAGISSGANVVGGDRSGETSGEQRQNDRDGCLFDRRTLSEHALGGGSQGRGRRMNGLQSLLSGFTGFRTISTVWQMRRSVGRPIDCTAASRD